MLARMVLTKSYGASSDVMFVVSMRHWWSVNSTLAPSRSITRAIVRVSASEGTLRSTCCPGASRVAAITGSAAFLAPLMAALEDQRIHGHRLGLGGRSGRFGTTVRVRARAHIHVSLIPLWPAESIAGWFDPKRRQVEVGDCIIGRSGREINSCVGRVGG